MKRNASVEARTADGIRLKMAISLDTARQLTRTETRTLMVAALSECMQSMERLPYMRVRVGELTRRGAL